MRRIKVSDKFSKQLVELRANLIACDDNYREALMYFQGEKAALLDQQLHIWAEMMQYYELNHLPSSHSIAYDFNKQELFVNENVNGKEAV